MVLSEGVAIHQAKHCERARAELDVRKYLYVRQRQELKILRAKIEAAEASNTKKSKAVKQKVRRAAGLGQVARSPARSD